ncbi:hypothetical protein [Micromonospora sp. NBC_00421]|uniref:hypothetical protein n=1 Tax=Micromonospora sp. NBC_00421 TaxID=2975976 RepID=UPI002E1DDF5F
MRLLKFLDELADHVRAQVNDETQVRVVGSGVRRAVEVAPGNAKACGFTVFPQDADELTIEFGEMSILDFVDESPEELFLACREVVDAIIAGKVSEVVYLKGVVPVRAVARLGLPDRVMTAHTLQGFSVFSRSGRTVQYEPYPAATT